MGKINREVGGEMGDISFLIPTQRKEQELLDQKVTAPKQIDVSTIQAVISQIDALVGEYPSDLAVSLQSCALAPDFANKREVLNAAMRRIDMDRESCARLIKRFLRDERNQTVRILFDKFCPELWEYLDELAPEEKS